MLLENENILATHAALDELYQISTQNITLHIKHIYEEDKLDERSELGVSRLVIYSEEINIEMTLFFAAEPFYCIRIS